MIGDPLIAVVLLALSLTLFWGRCWLTKHQPLESGQVIFQRWGGRIADFFYFVGLPYGAVIFGLLSVQWLGLRGLEFYSLMLGLVDASAGQWLAEVWRATTRLAMMLLLDSRAMLWSAGLTLLVWGGTLLGLSRAKALVLPHRLSLLDAIYDGVHWAFYRAIFWLLTGDLFYAVLFGILFAALELGLENYFLAESNGRQLLRAAMLILTAAIFYTSPTLWGTWLVHLTMVLIANYLVIDHLQLQSQKTPRLHPLEGHESV